MAVTEKVTAVPEDTDCDTGCTVIVGAETVLVDPELLDDDESPPQPETAAIAATKEMTTAPLTTVARMHASALTTLNKARMVASAVSRDFATSCRDAQHVNASVASPAARHRPPDVPVGIAPLEGLA